MDDPANSASLGALLGWRVKEDKNAPLSVVFFG
jgi:hypothetical protein